MGSSRPNALLIKSPNKLQLAAFNENSSDRKCSSVSDVLNIVCSVFKVSDSQSFAAFAIVVTACNNLTDVISPSMFKQSWKSIVYLSSMRLIITSYSKISKDVSIQQMPTQDAIR